MNVFTVWSVLGPDVIQMFWGGGKRAKAPLVDCLIISGFVVLPFLHITMVCYISLSTFTLQKSLPSFGTDSSIMGLVAILLLLSALLVVVVCNAITSWHQPKPALTSSFQWPSHKNLVHTLTQKSTLLYVEENKTVLKKQWHMTKFKK